VGSFEEREVWLSGNVLKVDPYSQVTWIWDLVLIRPIWKSNFPLVVKLQVVQSKIALTILEPHLPLSSIKESFEWRNRDKEERQERYSLVKAKS
jgi:hypothetical protein